MADFRKLSMSLILADGLVSDEEIKVLKKELYADGKIDQKEVQYLIELRNAAHKKAKAKKDEVNPKFEKMFFQAIEDSVLDNGIISAREARFLRELIFADKKVDANEKKLVQTLKKKATKTAPDFETLYTEVMAK
jgi:hypothetical protein